MPEADRWMIGYEAQKHQAIHKHIPQELSGQSLGPMEENIPRGSCTNKNPQAEIAEDEVDARPDHSIHSRGGRPVKAGTRVRMLSTRCGGDEY